MTTATDDPKLQPILNYISQGWDVLTRSTKNCAGVADPKLISSSIVYLPADFAVPPDMAKLAEDCKVRVLPLPSVIKGPGERGIHGEIDLPGLLYLENPYVVPGGRFNEMYGWDSYFIIRGLLRDGRVELARGMVENFFFEIEHYGAVLNANRTYYLTRSQPPFLSSMVQAVYEAEKSAGHPDTAWLAKAAHYIARDYAMWTHAPHLAGSTGLSRYCDLGEGPVPEGLHDESGYYRDVAAYVVRQGGKSAYLTEGSNAPGSSGFSLQVCENHPTLSANNRTVVKRLDLSQEAYKGDRSMRESGFDVSFRFGPFSLETDHYAPVCLNSLLYKTERDMEEISTLLGDGAAANLWRQRADQRSETLRKLMWDAGRGLFFDFNERSGKRSTYEYATTFYPLWAGLATAQEAQAIASNLHLFEHAGGLAMSRRDTGAQWDYPYGWAPIQLLAVEGLRKYGYDEDANRIAYKFLAMVLKNFIREGTIREKYNVVTDSSVTTIKEGYKMNVIGFGWTNAVSVEFLHTLPPPWLRRLAAE